MCLFFERERDAVRLKAETIEMNLCLLFEQRALLHALQGF